MHRLAYDPPTHRKALAQLGFLPPFQHVTVPWLRPFTSFSESRWNIPAGFTATKILWLKRHEPENFARVAHVLLPHDFVNFRLTGRLAMERGDASGTGLLDPATRAFSSAACEAVDARLLSLLPPLVGPDEAIGTVTEAAGKFFGLPAGVPVAPGGGDNMMAALGAGAVTPGRLVLSLGTSGTLFGVSERPLADPSGAVAPFCDCTGAYLPLVCVQNCTGPAEEVRAAFGSSHESLSKLAGETFPSSSPSCYCCCFITDVAASLSMLALPLRPLLAPPPMLSALSCGSG